ncbi:MAG: sulfotransferase [Bacteroidetes bacterium]|nr:sulfotransferase [Bacteroidota bacterium]
MSFIHSTILYVHIKTILKIIYLQCYKHFTLRRFIWTSLFVVIWSVFTIIVFTFRLLDEIFFFNYRQVEVKKPIFIISNPRSGTTFMHRLMSMDEGSYGYTYLYHTILPSITIFKIINLFDSIDKRIGRPMQKFFQWMDGIIFKGWEDIHPMGLSKTEEDEALYAFTGMSAGIFLLVPYIKEVYDVVFPDSMHEKSRKKLMNFYTNTIQRVMYAAGDDKVFLSKNVMSTGRLKSLHEAYPDARYIYLVRNPINTIPSFMSMFTTAWNAHSPDIPDDSDESRAWGEIGMDYYKYFDKFKDTIEPENMVIVKYDELVGHPGDTIRRIYEQFGMEVSEDYAAKLMTVTENQNKYKSVHNYSLEQYGMTREQVHDEIGFIFEKYGFDVKEAV